MSLRYSVALGILLASTSASAAPKVTVTPAAARPGDAVLVTVTGMTGEPKGTANGSALEFFGSRTGYQAVFAIPLDVKTETLAVDITAVTKPASVKILLATKFPETDVIVEDELANPGKVEREKIDGDNAAILGAVRKAAGEAQFVKPFVRPLGKITSTFGEWRTFNDGHRSQHLGVDLAANEGTRVNAINAGTVVLVRDGFLAGNLVVVAHGAGIASAYYHLSKVTVAEGDVVKAGAEIGKVGKTGRTTGPHLHLSVRVPGGFVDPLSFFKLRAAPKMPAIRTK